MLIRAKLNEYLDEFEKGGKNMESKIKIYGPPVDKAISELQKLAKELPTISDGAMSHSMDPSGEISSFFEKELLYT